MENKLGQEPVHPTPHYNQESGHMNGFSDGMNKRFYAACAAMQGIMAGRSAAFDNMSPVRVIEFSYKLRINF